MGWEPFTINPREFWSMLDCMAAMVLCYTHGPVVEIGSTFGESVREKRQSTIILSDRAELKGVAFYTCDFRKKVEMNYPKHEHFLMTSFDFMKNEVPKLHIAPALVLLDGCHDYPVVIEEVKFFLDILETHGLILLHDTYPPNERLLEPGQCSDSYRVRQEVEGWRDIVDCFTWPYTAGTYGLTMILKKAEDRPYFRQ